MVQHASGSAPRENDDLSSEGSADGLDVRPDSEGWEDENPDEDVESVAVKCLLCEESFGGAKAMVEHCKGAHRFDFLAVQRELGACPSCCEHVTCGFF